jgi:hypothetical protein
MNKLQNKFCHQEIKISPYILENYQFLNKIVKSKSIKKRSFYLRNATHNELLSLVEIASNILSPKFNLLDRHKKRLIPNAHLFRKLAKIRSEKGARKFFNQQGNGLPVILPSLLIPIIGEVARLLLENG